MFEVEAKFQVTSAAVFDQIRSRKQVAGYTLSDQVNTPQHDTYLDTTTGTLLENGASLRLRQKGLAASAITERIQLVTFKTPTKEVYTRTEFEMPLTDQQAQMLLNGNLNKIHVEAIQAAVTHLKGEKVFPILHVANTRETWRINSNVGCVEICLDDVQYADADKTRYSQEYGVEIELKNGETVFLQQIADALSEQYDLMPIFQSKYERGVMLLNKFADNTKN